MTARIDVKSILRAATRRGARACRQLRATWRRRIRKNFGSSVAREENLEKKKTARSNGKREKANRFRASTDGLERRSGKRQKRMGLFLPFLLCV